MLEGVADALGWTLLFLVALGLTVFPLLGVIEEIRRARAGKVRSRISLGDAVWLLIGACLGIYILSLLVQEL